MIYLFTENFFVACRLKNLVKRFLGKAQRGPKAVQNSLESGLLELGEDFQVNRVSNYMPHACVLSGVKTLRWAIQKKREGKIGKLFAGPNLVVDPREYASLICQKEIDKVIVPSFWVSEFYKAQSPQLEGKLEVWSAGVDDKGLLVKRDGYIVVLFKSGPRALQAEICRQLEMTGEKYISMFYGEFSQEEYFRILKETKALVYVSKSESQGLVLHEAWMAGVPTLVWNGGKFEYGALDYESPKIPAPYMEASCGLFFKDIKEFTDQLSALLKNYEQFFPREYSIKNFTNKISAQNFLNIIHVK